MAKTGVGVASRRAGTRWRGWLAIALLVGAGCGRSPEGGNSAPPGGSATPAGAPTSSSATYEETGLPRNLEFGGKRWELNQDMDRVSEGTYEKGTEQVDGKPVYHDPGATTPYPYIYLKVEGQDRYLQYAPASKN